MKKSQFFCKHGFSLKAGGYSIKICYCYFRLCMPLSMYYHLYLNKRIERNNHAHHTGYLNKTKRLSKWPLSFIFLEYAEIYSINDIAF